MEVSRFWYIGSIAGQCSWRGLVILLLAGLAGGCGRSRLDALPPASPVQGQIFVGGKPAAAAVIAFHPDATAKGLRSTSRGTADSEGKFSLTTYVAGDGAPEGEFVVTVYWPERPLNPHGEGDQLPADKLHGKYAAQANSNLRARVGQAPITFEKIDLALPEVLQASEYHLREQPQ
jgi:hypothetical protein